MEKNKMEKIIKQLLNLSNLDLEVLIFQDNLNLNTWDIVLTKNKFKMYFCLSRHYSALQWMIKELKYNKNFVDINPENDVVTIMVDPVIGGNKVAEKIGDRLKKDGYKTE